VVLGKQGRLVIPAEVRAALGLEPGDELNVQQSGTSLVLQRQEDAIAELRGFAKDAAKGRSLVDELIAERRAEAARE
jgi:AbrB family looped-hinge helix DNA binding protein